MARASTGGSAAARGVGIGTGRDGAIDHALKQEGVEAVLGVEPNHVYRVIELVGTSQESIEDAVKSAIARAQRTLRNLRWFEIVRTGGHVDAGRVAHFQVTMKVGFTMEDAR